MMKVLLLAAALIEEAGFAEIGIDLFVGTMAGEDTKGVMVCHSGLVGADVDEGMEDFYDTEFQVIVRDPNAEEGYARCEAISKALRLDHVERDDLSITWMRRKTLPVTYPRGDGDDVETSVRIRVGFGELA